MLGLAPARRQGVLLHLARTPSDCVPRANRLGWMSAALVLARGRAFVVDAERNRLSAWGCDRKLSIKLTNSRRSSNTVSPEALARSPTQRSRFGRDEQRRDMNTLQEWDSLCGKYESAQDEYTTAYLAISARLLAGGAGKFGARPTVSEVARWDASRARVRDIDERMRGFVARLVGRPTPDGAGSDPIQPKTKRGAELH